MTVIFNTLSGHCSFIASLSFRVMTYITCQSTEFVLYLAYGKGKYREEADWDLHEEAKSGKVLRSRVFQKRRQHFSCQYRHSFIH